MPPTRSQEATRSARLPDDVFVGREREMEELRVALEAALGGRGRLVLLAGEPGIGKTRIAHELATHARARGADVLVGHCTESEGAPPFWPWVQIVRGFIAGRDPETLKTMMGAGAPAIAQIMTEVRDRVGGLLAPPALEPQQERFRFFDSFTAFLRNAARAQPLVLILDDLPWADTPSLLLLQFLARELADAHLLIVGTYRDVQLEHQPPLRQALGELARVPGSASLVLHGLSEPDVARFIELATGHPPADALVAAVHEKTEGNPFFVTEVVRMLTADGRERTLADAHAAIGLPLRVREAIAHRVRTLSEDCHRLLTVAAAIGREFNVNVLATAAGVGPAAADGGVLGVLDEAVAARLIVPHRAGHCSFSHALIRETLYEAVAGAERVRLHGQVGEALEEIHSADPEPYLAELAFHFFEAAPGGAVEKAVRYAERAGERAMRLLAYEEAVSHYEQALQVHDLREPDERRRGELLLVLGDALWRAGESARAREIFIRAAQVAGALGAADLLARAALGLGNVRAETGVVDDALVGLLEAALTALGEEDGAPRARVLARLAIALYFAPASEERRHTLSLQALAMAQRVGDRGTLAFALLARHFVLWGTGSVEERLALATEIVRLAEDAGDLGIALEGQAWKILALLELGDVGAVDREIERYARQSVNLRTPRNRWYLSLVRSGRAFLAGAFEEGERLATEAASVQGEGGELANAGMFFAAQLFTLRREQGRLDELEPALTAFAAQFATLPIWRCSLAVFHCAMGDGEAARRELDHLAVQDFAALPHDANRLPALALLAEACSMLGDAERAARLYQLLLPYAERNIVVATAAICYGPAARYLGLLATACASWDDAARHFTDALRMSERMGARPWAAHTQHDHARMLLARGRPEDERAAGDLLDVARQTAASLGMKNLVDTVDLHRAPMSSAAPRAPTPRSDGPTQASHPVFRREGDYWTVVFQGPVLRLKDSTGARYLSHLLQHPHQEIHVFDLAGLGAPPRSGRKSDAAALAEGGLHPVTGNDGGPLLDAKARAAYKRRLADLRSELDEARDANDIGRAEKLDEEVRFLSRELGVALGLHRQGRRAPSSADQARVNVTRSIKRVIQKIEAQDRALGLHLRNTVNTGLFCSYTPDPRLPIAWQG